jgi:predicted GH43/DUF377 family glycosyl hydrolase
MSLEIKKHGVILEKTQNSFETHGVLNPAIVQEGNTLHMVYRAVREGNFSSLGYCKLKGPLEVSERSNKPIFFPEHDYEFKGIEDPRLVKIEDTYYLSYSAYDGVNVFGAYATSKDLRHFQRQGIITPKFNYEEYAGLMRQNFEQISEKHLFFYEMFIRYRIEELMKGKIYVWDKNLIFFPEKINGKFAVLHRLYPSIQVFYFNETSELTPEFWREHVRTLRNHIVIRPRYHFECSHIGGGCPPLRTPQGWLFIYHAAESTKDGLIYHAGAALLDIEDPNKVIAQLKRPLFSPSEEWEKKGVVNNVVFPSGMAVFGDELYIYYGAADERIAVASVNLQELIIELQQQSRQS